MYCSKCGNELKEDALFCNKCGSKIKNNNEKVEQKNISNIELVIKNIIDGITNVNYKGIYLFNNKYILTDGFRLIVFKNEIESKDIIEKYRIQTNKINQSLSFNFNDFQTAIEIKIDDINLIKEHIKLKPNEPYIISYNNKNYGINPKYLLEAMEMTNSNSIWITEDVCNPYVLKGQNYDYYIEPIKIKEHNPNSNEIENARFRVKVSIIAFIIIVALFGGIIIKENGSMRTYKTTSAENAAKSQLGNYCREGELKVKTIEEKNGIYIVECKTTNSDLKELYGSTFYFGYMPNASETSYYYHSASTKSEVYNHLNKY